MNTLKTLCVCASLLVLPMVASAGAYNATATGRVTMIQQIGITTGYTNETITFTIDTQPTVNCGSGFQRFVFSPTSVTDAQMRKNFLAMLFAAKASGDTITVGYDSNATSCDQGMPFVYWMTIQ